MSFVTKWFNLSGCEYLCTGCDRDCHVCLANPNQEIHPQKCDGTREGGQIVCESIGGQIPEPQY
ncbi:MAG: hypothetical protein PHN69_06425 [Candidatus Pacebacteria bacterium]|nr:hypothetical protein [Candidatus Paceibacterota bacterium]